VSGHQAASRLREAVAGPPEVVDRLAVLSRRHYHNPYAESAQAWPQTIAPADSWCTAPESEQDDFLFFAKTMIFEEIVGYYNALQAKDMRLHPMARFINKYHHDEETRHLVFGRRLVTRLWEVCSPAWGEQVREDVREYLRTFIAMAWREYYKPDVYPDCGLDDPWGVAERAWQSPPQRSHPAHCLSPVPGRLANRWHLR
jgi:hypothetical protein